jgi:hypothetical protein
MTTVDVETPPRVTPALLRWADTMCPRRLAGLSEDKRGNRAPDVRFRVANRVFESARLAHIDLSVPSPEAFSAGVGLEPEEATVYEAAARWYLALFGERAVRAVDLDDWESTIEEIGVRLVGPGGLPVEDAQGCREVRILHVGVRRTEPGDPLESIDGRFAVLRAAEWAAGSSLRLAVADLVGGALVEREIDVDHVLETELRPWLAARVAVIRERAADPTPRPGLECARCPYVAGCAAHA